MNPEKVRELLSKISGGEWWHDGAGWICRSVPGEMGGPTILIDALNPYRDGPSFGDLDFIAAAPDIARAYLAQAEEMQKFRQGWIDENHEIEQVLGKALGYPWYNDDQKNFPGATEADGVCVGSEVGITLVHQAAEKILEQLKRVVNLERIVLHTLWMAGRYADGRSTYAVEDYNTAVRIAIDLALKLQPDPTTGTVFAKDGTFGYPAYASDYPALHQPKADE